MEIFALLFMGALGLGALFSGPSDEDDAPAEEGTDQTGTDGDDELVGNAQDDTLRGEAGDDTLRGEAGDDLIYGGEGSDIVEGGDGDDELYGENIAFEQGRSNGDDILRGGAGNDTIYDGAGDDVLHGGDGDDELHALNGDDVLYGGDGNDTLSSTGHHGLDGGHNVLHGGAGDDTLTSSSGFEDGQLMYVANELYGDDGDDYLRGVGILDGGDGDDTLYAEATYTGGVTTTLTGGPGVDTFVVGYNSTPPEDAVPYDPVRITDFYGNGGASTLVITVDFEVNPPGGFSTSRGDDHLTISVNDIYGNAHDVAILEGVTGEIDPDNIQFVHYA